MNANKRQRGDGKSPDLRSFAFIGGSIFFPWRTLASLAVQFFAKLSGEIHFANAPRSLNINPLRCERSQAAARRLEETKIIEVGRL